MNKLNRFDNFEYHPCRLVDMDEVGNEILEQCDETDKNIHLWSVYGHFKEDLRETNGCLECLYDFSSKELAEKCCESLKTFLKG